MKLNEIINKEQTNEKIKGIFAIKGDYINYFF